MRDFFLGNEELGWDGIYDRWKDSSELDVPTKSEVDTKAYLQRAAVALSAYLKPLYDRINLEVESRFSGSDINNISIPSWYMNTYGEQLPPDYLNILPPENSEMDQGIINVGTIDSTEFYSGGYVGGIAGGMDDTVPATIDGNQQAALSSGEFVIPADVVSHLGDGNNENGASKLYNFLDQVRVSKTGNIEQPNPMDDGIFSNLIGS